jgi:hypothetical protein
LTKLNNSTTAMSLRNDDDKLTANYVSTISRASLQAALKAELVEFRLVNSAASCVVVTKTPRRSSAFGAS